MHSVDVVLLEGIRAGQFGGESKPHGDHAMGFVRFSDDAEKEFRGHVVDIGSGAGLPALVLADAFPRTTWTLIERRRGRTELLTRAVHRLGLGDRMEIIAADAAVAAHGHLRAQADWVTARSFGPPGDTAECGSAFLRPGGSLLVSEPFDVEPHERWPKEGLALTGLSYLESWTTESGRYARFRRTRNDIPTLPRQGARKKLLF
jgi:hypothetical protein